MSTTTDLEKLKINYLTQEQYDAAVENNNINENELYFTPGADEGALGDIVTYTPTVASGTELGKININGTPNSIYAPTVHKVIQIDVPSFSSLPQTISNSSITADHVVVNSVLGSPSAQISDWAWITFAGSITISGSINGSTTLTLYLDVKE